jgi:hypothetical protein
VVEVIQVTSPGRSALTSHRPDDFERQLSLILGPIDDIEDHSSPEHFGFEISGTLNPALMLDCLVHCGDHRFLHATRT